MPGFTFAESPQGMPWGLSFHLAPDTAVREPAGVAMMSIRRMRRAVGGLALVSGALLLVHCGGGTDIAPSEPVPGGDGSGTVRLAATDVGSTTLVDGAVSAGQAVAPSVVDEAVTIRADGYGVLANAPLSTSAQITLTGPSGSPVYCQGLSAACVGVLTCGPPAPAPPDTPCDFWLADSQAGLIQVSPSGAIPAGPTTVLADYTYSGRLLELNVGLTLADGQFVNLVFHHVPATAAAPLSIQPVSQAPPPAPYDPAFYVSAITNLTSLGGRREYSALDDPGNLATLTRIDVTDEVSPCLAGDVHVKVNSLADPNAVDLDVSFETAGCL